MLSYRGVGFSVALKLAMVVRLKSGRYATIRPTVRLRGPAKEVGHSLIIAAVYWSRFLRHLRCGLLRVVQAKRGTERQAVPLGTLDLVMLGPGGVIDGPGYVDKI